MVDVLTIIAPVFVIMLLGYGLGKTPLFPEGSDKAIVAFVWYVAIPALMFRSLAPRELPHANEMVFVASYYSVMLALYGVAYFLARYAFKSSQQEAGIFSLSTCFANGGFIGIPVLEGAYGPEGVRLLLMLLSFHSLTLVPLTTVIIESGNGKQTDGPGLLYRTFASVRQNPIVVSLLIGLAWSAMRWPVPEWLDRVLALPANSAAPTGLFVVGLALSNVKIAGNLGHAMFAIAMKLLALPAAVFVVTHFVLGLDPTWVGVTTLFAAMPSGMMGYTMAIKYGIAPRRAATTTLVSTGLSMLTLTAVLALLAASGFVE